MFAFKPTTSSSADQTSTAKSLSVSKQEGEEKWREAPTIATVLFEIYYLNFPVFGISGIIDFFLCDQTSGWPGHTHTHTQWELPAVNCHRKFPSALAIQVDAKTCKFLAINLKFLHISKYVSRNLLLWSHEVIFDCVIFVLKAEISLSKHLTWSLLTYSSTSLPKIRKYIEKHSPYLVI